MGALTPNFSFNLPTDGGDDAVWGALLNANWTALDTSLKATNDAVALNTAKTGNATHTGDVTSAGALTIGALKVTTSHIALLAVGTAQLAATAVTNAKLGLLAVDTAQLAADAVEEAKIADNAVTIAKMAHGTDGELITYDAAGAPAKVAVGTVGQVLTSGGAGVAPTMQDAAEPSTGWEYVEDTFDYAVDGAASTVESALFVSGYDYQFRFDGCLSSTNSDWEMDFYRSVSATWVSETNIHSNSKVSIDDYAWGRVTLWGPMDADVVLTGLNQFTEDAPVGGSVDLDNDYMSIAVNLSSGNACSKVKILAGGSFSMQSGKITMWRKPA